jgi:hypothetical protein
MSAFIAGEVPIDQIMQGHERFALVAIPAKLCRDHGQMMVRRVADLPGHVEVIGQKSLNVRAHFALRSEWIVPPPADYQLPKH